MCLIARVFEEEGLPTLILGSALDILEAGQAPRAQFLNYPLGFTAGRFQDRHNQYEVVKTALQSFDTMRSPGIQSMNFDWDNGWQMINERELLEQDNDTRSPRDTLPRYQTEDDRIRAESNPG